jgi:hypothetical protein
MTLVLAQLPDQLRDRLGHAKQLKYLRGDAGDIGKKRDGSYLDAAFTALTH